MQELTCCFSGHRHLPQNKVQNIVSRLDKEIDALIQQGIINFISGGALGFDQIAASLIIAKKEMGRPVRLLFALPCRDQSSNWTDIQKKHLCNLLSEADDIIYISEKYYDGCMKKRNRYMVEHSAFCICALMKERTGTSQTVSLARRKGLRIINVAE